MEHELVIVADVADGWGLPCRNGCGRNLELDRDVVAVIEQGGSVICRWCLLKLKLEHPEGLERVEQWPPVPPG